MQTTTTTITITEITSDLDRDDQLAIRDELVGLARNAHAVCESTDGEQVTITDDGFRPMTAAAAIREIEGDTYRYETEANCWDPQRAAELAAAGVTVEQAATHTTQGLGGYEDTVGYKVANADLTVAQAKNLVA